LPQGSPGRLLIETADYIGHGILQEPFLTDTRELPVPIEQKCCKKIKRHAILLFWLREH
jgi:hypothetical protein